MTVTTTAALCAAIEQEDWASFGSIFLDARYPAPSWRWNPDETDLAYGSLRHALAYWRSLCGGDALPSLKSIDPDGLRPHLGLVTLLEPTEDDGDFRYRLYGSKVADLAGFEMNGKCVSEMKLAPVIVAFVIAGHMAVSRRREPLLSIHEPPPTSNVSLWTRLILPYAGDDGEVARLLVMNQPGELRQPGADRLPRYYKQMLD